MTIDRNDILEVLRTIPDPEMPISIVDLGLVADVRINPPLHPGVGEGLGVRARHAADDQINSAPAASMPSPQPSPKGRGSDVTVDLLPTFVGCPALDMIAGDVRAKLTKIPGIESVSVNWLFDPPWTVDRITLAGRASLKEHGVTVPAPGSGNRLPVPAHESTETVQLRTSAIPCPFCGSTSTYLDSPFGPTRCRMIYYCDACRNSFEHLKRV